jgi:hypothetical protein
MRTALTDLLEIEHPGDAGRHGGRFEERPLVVPRTASLGGADDTPPGEVRTPSP